MVVKGLVERKVFHPKAKFSLERFSSYKASIKSSHQFLRSQRHKTCVPMCLGRLLKTKHTCNEKSYFLCICHIIVSSSFCVSTDFDTRMVNSIVVSGFGNCHMIFTRNSVSFTFRLVRKKLKYYIKKCIGHFLMTRIFNCIKLELLCVM